MLVVVPPPPSCDAIATTAQRASARTRERWTRATLEQSALPVSVLRERPPSTPGPRARSDSNTWRLRDGATSSHLRMRKQRERASSQNCQVTEKLPPQPSPPPFWRSQHHTLTWQRRGAPPAPLLPHPSPSKKACPASEGKKNKPYRPRADPPNDPALPFCGPTSFCQVYFFKSGGSTDSGVPIGSCQ